MTALGDNHQFIIYVDEMLMMSVLFVIVDYYVHSVPGTMYCMYIKRSNLLHHGTAISVVFSHGKYAAVSDSKRVIRKNKKK
jgi:hypothetical protein